MSGAAPEDRDLVERANHGDSGAFEALYRRHRDWTVSVAWRLTGRRDDALDILQDVFAGLFQRFPGFTLTSTLRGYLYPAVRHAAISLARKRNRVVTLDPARMPEAAAPDPPLPPDWSPDFERRIAGLSEGHREVLRLRFVFDLRIDEIAEALDLPAGTVKSRLHNALESLKSGASSANS